MSSLAVWAWRGELWRCLLHEQGAPAILILGQFLHKGNDA